MFCEQVCLLLLGHHAALSFALWSADRSPFTRSLWSVCLNTRALSVYTACETLGFFFFFCVCCLRERDLFSYHIWSCGAKPIGSRRLMPYKHLSLAFSLLLSFFFVGPCMPILADSGAIFGRA